MDALVGVEHECDFPADVVGLPILTKAQLDAEGASRAIHESVTGPVWREGRSAR